jgi:hypothetical protein
MRENSKHYNHLRQLHCEEGPAIRYPNGDVEWWLNNYEYSFHAWCMRVNISEETKMLLKLRYA